MSDEAMVAEGCPPELVERAQDARAALKAADAVFLMDPTDPIALAAGLAARREAMDAKALLDEFHTGSCR